MSFFFSAAHHNNVDIDRYIYLELARYVLVDAAGARLAVADVDGQGDAGRDGEGVWRAEVRHVGVPRHHRAVIGDVVTHLGPVIPVWPRQLQEPDKNIFEEKKYFVFVTKKNSRETEDIFRNFNNIFGEKILGKKYLRLDKNKLLGKYLL